MALTETFHTAGFLVSEAEGSLSREIATILSGQNLKAGAVLGKVTKDLTAANTTTAFTGTGNGAITKDATTPVLAGAKVGAYKIVCVEPAANLGTFAVYDPDGVYLGAYVVGAAAFATQIKFTIADGATDFIAGDFFTFTVVAGSLKYKEYNPANTDGSEIAIAVLYADCDASAADKTGQVIIARNAEVNSSELIWFTDADANQKAAGRADLALQRIIGR